MNLYVRYRPETWEEVFGNDDTVAMLRAVLALDDPPVAYLLTGPTGCGKTTFARLIMRDLGADPSNVLSAHEMNSADHRGIDVIRDIVMMSHHGLRDLVPRVTFFDEAHKLTNDASTALLKTLEEPPTRCHYIFATTEPDGKLIATLRGRCIEVAVKPLTVPQMVELLDWICRSEDREVSQDVLHAIARKHVPQAVLDESGGGCYPRFAIQLLEQVLVMPDEPAQLRIIKNGPGVETRHRDRQPGRTGPAKPKPRSRRR